MSARRSGAGVGVLGHTLYAVGGHDGPLVRKSVECYNAETDQWKAVSDMNYCRRNAGENGGCNSSVMYPLVVNDAFNLVFCYDQASSPKFNCMKNTSCFYPLQPQQSA